MDGIDLSSAATAGGSSTGPDGTDGTNLADGSEPGSPAVGGNGEPGSILDPEHSSVSETTSDAVPGRSAASETSERPLSANADEDRAASGQRPTSSTADWLKETEKNMATLLEILKANGATEADLEMMKPLLSNQKFSGAIESELTAKGEWERKAAESSGKLSEFESQRNQFEAQAEEAKKKVTQYDEWYNGVLPTLQKVQQDTIAAAAEAASAKAQLSKAKEMYGFDLPTDVPTVVTGSTALPNSPVATAPTSPAATRSDLPDLSNYITADRFAQEANVVGSAIADVQDLAFEHIALFGYNKPINMAGLRQKAVAEKRPIREIWERELHVADRKGEIAAAAESERVKKYQEELAAARKEGYIEGASQSINPMTREPQNSRFGVAFTKRDSEGAKPWEAVSGRAQDRLQKVVSTLAKQGAA